MNIKEYLVESRMKAGDLAYLLGVGQNRLSEFIHGQRPVSLPIAKKLVALSGGKISYDDLAMIEIGRRRKRSNKKESQEIDQEEKEQTEAEDIQNP